MANRRITGFPPASDPEAQTEAVLSILAASGLRPARGGEKVITIVEVVDPTGHSLHIGCVDLDKPAARPSSGEVLERLRAAAEGAEPIVYAGRDREIACLRELLAGDSLDQRERASAEARLAELLGD